MRHQLYECWHHLTTISQPHTVTSVDSMFSPGAKLTSPENIYQDQLTHAIKLPNVVGQIRQPRVTYQVGSKIGLLNLINPAYGWPT